MILSVPNVSEGRRLDVIASIAGAIRRVPGARLLDSSSDVSHNRSVFTIAGERGPITGAAMALVERAVADIDLRTHRGEHPRLGAVDVVPFVPLAGASMEDCITLAREVGAAIAERFLIPVYLYEEAATSPARTHLEHIRRGQFEGLAAKMMTPGWAPDFGPPAPHPTAGATIVGARMPLIAYNINLATGRIEVARRVASAVRSSGGGLRYVKAMAVTLHHRGIVQVSMNLTNYRETPIIQVFETVKREAARDGVSILESEIVGLVPAAALAGTTARELRLKDLGSDRIIENTLKDAR
ncbi:MAG: glutamate formimidoyltransferase [Acidobacteria bacterium RIFCSPLOWO2_02_FULL_64_15]|nr:MAG: glutamate formimidoyltransferase [Acidobacteria bacterium RIFCSPLOWO2_02_FULL_64_15]